MMTEHHFHSEGFEFSVNPLMFLTDLAARTERILLAPLGIVLPAWDPIRAAEDVALLDHFSKGRLRLGVARGYQNRWMNVLGQRWQATAARSDGSRTDTRNFDVFGEVLKIMKMAWTQDTLRYKSDVLDYEVPAPFDGIEGWPALEWTRKFGAPGEVDDQGRIHAVSVGPEAVPESVSGTVAAVHHLRPLGDPGGAGGHPAVDVHPEPGRARRQGQALPGGVGQVRS